MPSSNMSRGLRSSSSQAMAFSPAARVVVISPRHFSGRAVVADMGRGEPSGVIGKGPLIGGLRTRVP